MTKKKRENPVRIRPTVGEVYENIAGGFYRCTGVCEPGLESWMQNTATGWTLLAHGIIRFQNGLIEWDYSTGGHFEEIQRAEIRSRQISLANALLCLI